MGAPWYTYPRIDQYGTPDPFGGFPKPDSNIQVPDNYPITALLGGTVTGINSPSGSIPAWGAVVTIKLDSPLNPIATHTAYLHLASIAPGLAVGSHVSAGDLIGYSGGKSAAGSQKVPLGFALYHGPFYGFGPEWSQYLGSPSLNMTALLTAAAKGTLNVPGGTDGAGGSAPISGGGIIGLDAIFSWISSLQGLWNWLSNPVRLLKVVTGILLILGSIVLLVTPGDTLTKKALFVSRL